MSLATPELTRWKYRFSLRTLLVAMLVILVTFAGWLAYRRHLAATHRRRVAEVEEVIAELETRGAQFSVIYDEMRPRSWLEEWFDDPGPDDDPFVVIHTPSVYFEGSGIKDADVELLATLPGVESVTIFDSSITDAGLAHLAQLNDLCELWMDSGEVSDAGLKHLKGLSNLHELCLIGAQVTDAGLDDIKSLRNLKRLVLDLTYVTDAGLADVQRALPNCSIESEISPFLPRPHLR